jgi:DUF971 family protein
MSEHVPTEIALHQGSRVLEITFSDGVSHRLPCEFLRVYSPSAEVRGHGPGQEVLQTGKQDVNIGAIEPVGNYGVRLVFTDGHDTGLYSWDYLHELAVNQARLWKEYLERLQAAGGTRDGGAESAKPASPKPAPAATAWKKL